MLPLPINPFPPPASLYSTPILALLLNRLFHYEPDIVDEIRQCYYAQRRHRRRNWHKKKSMLKIILAGDYWISHHMTESHKFGVMYITSTKRYIPILHYVQEIVSYNESGMGIINMYQVLTSWCNSPKRGLWLFTSFLTAACIIKQGHIKRDIKYLSPIEYDDLWSRNLSYLTNCTASQRSA